MVGNGVQELRRRVAAAEALELVGIDPILVRGDAANFGFVAAKAVDGPEVRRRLDGGDVAGIEHRRGEEAEGVDGAAGDHQLARSGTPPLSLGEAVGERAAKPRQAGGWGVLECDRRVAAEQRHRQISEHRDRERLRVRQAPGKGDEVSPTGELEDGGELATGALSAARKRRRPAVSWKRLHEASPGGDLDMAYRDR